MLKQHPTGTGEFAMFLKFDQINYLAVAVAGLGAFFIGALWYMPFFGKLWVRLHGFSDEKVKQMQARVPPPLFFGGMIAVQLVTAFVVALLVVSLNPTAPLDGVLLGSCLWLLVAAILFSGQLASDRHYGIFAIDTAYHFTLLIFMSVLLTLWR
jgi:hypothetical protein